jgi:tocopherol cyclase
MLNNWRVLWQPALYHGHGKSNRFFEGWYFKLVDATRQRRYAIIPGIFLDDGDGRDSHAFVQVLDGMQATVTYVRYPVAQFHADRRTFDIRVGPNHFRTDRLRLDLSAAQDAPIQRITGEVRFQQQVPWPVTLTSPGIMGWYAYLPFMECYHGVVSLDHALTGALTIDGEPVDFAGGRGYMEKDWGQAFPSAYIWFQSNHFPTPGTSLTASVATIPWLGSEFRGYIVGLWHAGTLYRFTTYTGAKITRLDLSASHVDWTLTGRTAGALHRLTLRAARAPGGMLLSPERAAMQERVAESMTAAVEMKLERITGRQVETIFSGTGDCASLEVVGDLDRIVD